MYLCCPDPLSHEDLALIVLLDSHDLRQNDAISSAAVWTRVHNALAEATANGLLSSSRQHSLLRILLFQGG